MQYIRKFALGVSVSLLFTTLFVFGLVFGLHRVFGGPQTIKSALKDSGIYQSAVGDALKQAQKQQQNEGAKSEEQIPIDRPEVQNIIKTAASPELLQSQTEKVIDAVYAWVQGKTPKLQFAIDLGSVKPNLANGVEQYAKEHLASLPVCPGTSAKDDVDPFNATCLPKGTSADQVAAKAKDQILNGDFLKDTTISSDTIKTDNGKTLEQQLQAVPAAYKRFNQVMYVLIAAIVVLSLGVVFLSSTWRSGLKKLSIIYIVVGSMSALLSLLGSFGVSRLSTLAKEPLQQSAVKVAQALANDLRSWWLWYGVVLVVVGVTTLVVLHFTKSKKTTDEPSSPATVDTKQDEPKPEVQQRPKPVKKLVQ